MYQSVPDIQNKQSTDTLWVTLKLPLQEMPRLQVVQNTPHPRVPALHSSLLNRDQARLYLALMSQLGQKPDAELDISTMAPAQTGLMRQVQERLDEDEAPPLHDPQSVTFTALVVETSSEWELARLQFNGGDLWIGNQNLVQGDRLPVRIHATDVSISLSAHADSSFLNILPVVLTRIEESQVPGMCELRLRAGHDGTSDLLIPARISRRSAKQLWLTPGLRLWAQIKSAAIVI